MNYKQIMMADGAPKGLFLTAAQRAKTWEGRSLTTVPMFKVVRDDTPETAAFRVQAKADAIVALKNRLARSAARKQTKAIDYSKMRWDAMRNKFVEITVTNRDKMLVERLETKQSLTKADAKEARALKFIGIDLAKSPDQTVVGFKMPESWQRVDYANARRLAEINGVWDDKYLKLSGGLLVMTVTNRLKGLVRKGGTVSWG